MKKMKITQMLEIVFQKEKLEAKQMNYLRGGDGGGTGGQTTGGDEEPKLP